MREAFDTELLVLRRQRRLVAAAKRQERRKIGSLGEILGKLETGARRRRVRIHGIVQQPKTLLVGQILVTAATLGALAQNGRKPQRFERRPPQLALGEGSPEHGQGV